MPEQSNPKLRPTPLPPANLGAQAQADYAELDVTSNFSFLRGASHPDELVYRAAELGYRAIAITDLNSLAGVVRAHAAARQVAERGGTPPKLLIGARLTLSDAPDLLVWPTDRAAYGRLCRLLTLGKRRAAKGECSLTLEDFLNHNEGLLAAIASTTPDDSIENRKSKIENGEGRHEGTEARRHRGGDKGAGVQSPAAPPIKNQKSKIKNLLDALGDRLSLATACLYSDDDRGRLDTMIRLARRLNIPILATNHVHYHIPQRRMLQDVLVCIREGCTIHEAGYRLFPNGERYLKPPAQMQRLFADHPAAIRRGLEIAERCTFSLDELKYEYPHEVVPAGKTAIEYLAELTRNGAKERYPQGVPPKVLQLIDHELELIEKLKYEAYFLTVYDLVTFARSRGILCQGRGSAANSAVCYCLGITSVDPDRIDVLFERFVSAARNEPPDIDVDFEHERREEVIQYIYEKYGRDRAGMTAEVITYRGRSAVRDVGKALGLSLDLVDQLAGKLDWWHRGTLCEEHLSELGLNPADRTVRLVVELTGQLLGFPRHLSQHVGGMVMTAGPLCELVPIENAAMENRTVIEWDKDDIDALGILKVDCLGLGMLTCVSKALSLINGTGEGSGFRVQGSVGSNGESRNPKPESMTNDEGRMTNGRGPQIVSCPLQLHTVPPEDPAVYDMIANADTVGVFQIESRAQMSMLPRLRPRCFYDLVIEVAIVRPGPIQGNMVHPYLRRRNGEEPVTYPSEALRQVLQKTLGVPLFQEQAMRVAMVGAGFTADEADKLRRAMAAWRRNGSIDAFRQKIIDGMLKNGYTREFAEQCFLQIRGFGEYGFPESHAASFALLVYASAWIKRYYPAAFCAALLNSQPMGFYAPAQIVRDAREHGVEVRPVDVNFSEWDCTLEGSGFGVQGSVARNDEARNPKPESMTNDEVRMAKGESDTRHEGTEARRHEGRERLPAHSGLSTQDSALRKAEGTEPRRQGGGDKGEERHEGTEAIENRKSKIENPLRLGLRLIRGLRRDHANQVVAARQKIGQFTSIPQFQRVTALPRHVIRRLAEADAFASLGLTRRQALWQAMELDDRQLPLFDDAAVEGSGFGVQGSVEESDKATQRRSDEGRGFGVRGSGFSGRTSQHSGLRTQHCAGHGGGSDEATKRRSDGGSGWIADSPDSIENRKSKIENPHHSGLSTHHSPLLPPMPLAQEVMTDYATAGLSLKQHPIALVRPTLDEMGIATAQQIRDIPHGTWVRVAGLVLIRQRPGTASGIVFETIEDETGIVNLIVRPDVYERYRPAARHAALLRADGRIERQGQVVHVMVRRMFDLSHLIQGHRHTSRDFH